MARFILVHEDEFISYDTTASTEDASYPDDNIEDYEAPSKEWRSTSTSETTLLLDTGTSGQAIAAVFVHGVNFTSLTIEGNDTNTKMGWASPSFTTSVTVSEDERSKRYKGFFELNNFAYQYLRLKIPSQTPTDGESFFRIGAVVLCEMASEIPVNPKYGDYSWRVIKPAKEIEFEGGATEFAQLGLHRRFEADLSFRASSTQEPNIWAKWNRDAGDVFILYENGAMGGGDEKAWLMRLITQMSAQWTGWENFETETITLREIV